MTLCQIAAVWDLWREDIIKLTTNVLNNKLILTMTITIKNSNPCLVNRFHNYFYNKGVWCMLCNDETEVTLFDLDRTEAELLLAAFTKHFHLKPATSLAMDS